MSKERHHIDEYFRDGLKDFEFAAPPDSWKNIESQLDKKRRGGMITIWTGLAAGLAILIGLGTYMKYASHDQKIIKANAISMTSPNTPNSKSPNNKGNAFAAQTITKTQGGYSESKNMTNPTIAENNIVNKQSQISIENHQVKKNTDYQSPAINQNYSLNVTNPENNGINSSNEKLVARNQNNGMSLSYISPLGVDLKSNTKPALALQKENGTETKPTIEPNSVLAENIVNTPKINRWSISGQLAPQYSYRKSQQPAGTISNEENGLMAYTGGFKVDYKTSRRLSIQTGIFYSVMGQTLNNIKGETYASAYQNYATTSSNTVIYSVNNSMGPIVSKSTISGKTDQVLLNVDNSPAKANNTLSITAMNNTTSVNTQTATIIQELKFIEIPFLARFKLIDKKIGLNLLGGISTNFLVNSDAILKQGGSTEKNWKTGDLNTINYSGTLGLGISYQIIRKCELTIEPTYKYYLNSISTNKDFNYRPYAFGIFTGVIYKF